MRDAMDEYIKWDIKNLTGFKAMSKYVILCVFS